jgi:hypothetical protein
MKSIKSGKNISTAEITNISEFGFWIWFNGKEYFLPFDEYPWFNDCTSSVLFNFEVDRRGHFYWPELDVDLHVDILKNPGNYPLKYNSPNV